jgi:hypothetical protein
MSEYIGTGCDIKSRRPIENLSQFLGTLTKRPRTKRPKDFLSQKFCNEASLGQSSPWTKHPRQICSKTSPFSGTDCPSLKIKLKTIFSDKTSLTHKKHTFWFLTHFLLYTFHRPHLKYLNDILCAAPAPLLLPWRPGPCGPGGPAPPAWPSPTSLAQPRLGLANYVALPLTTSLWLYLWTFCPKYRSIAGTFQPGMLWYVLGRFVRVPIFV